MNQLDAYFDEIFGQQFDNQNWISKEDDMVHIEEVNGGSQDWELTSSDLSRAINDNQGETKKVLMKIKDLLEDEEE